VVSHNNPVGITTSTIEFNKGILRWQFRPKATNPQFTTIPLRGSDIEIRINIYEEATRTAKEYEKQLDDPTYYSYNIWHFSYQAKSMYLKYIQDWFRYFPKEQFHFIIFEELIKNPTKVYYDFFEFIGLDNERIPNELSNVNLRVNIKMKDDYRLSLMKKFEPMIKDLEKLIDKDLSIWLKKK